MSGVYPTCNPCASGSVCPGATAAPLFNYSSTSSWSSFASACPPLTGPLQVFSPPATSLGPVGISHLTGTYSVDVTLILGFLLVCAVGGVFSLSRFIGKLSATLAWFDAFKQSFVAAPTAAKKDEALSIVYRARAVGGAFTLMGGISFATIALVLILQRAADNTLVTNSIVTATYSRLAFGNALPAVNTAPWGSALQLRVTASGGSSSTCATPLSWSASSSDGWIMTSTTSCGSDVSQLVFSCTGSCKLTPASDTEPPLLIVTLPFSCQSLLIEAGAVDVSGAFTSYAIPVSMTVATPGVLLSSISWSLSTALSIMNSTVSPSFRGYAIVGSSKPTVTTQTLSSDASGLRISPLASAVTLRVAFPVGNYADLTVLTEKQTILQLFASIIGLGGIFSLFGSLLSMVEATHAYSSRRRRNLTAALGEGPTTVKMTTLFGTLHTIIGHVGKRFTTRSSGRLTSSQSASLEDDAAVVKETPAELQNPLHIVSEADDVNSAGQAPSVLVTWTRYSDDINTWYRSSTGETAWETPEGAVVVE